MLGVDGSRTENYIGVLLGFLGCDVVHTADLSWLNCIDWSIYVVSPQRTVGDVMPRLPTFEASIVFAAIINVRPLGVKSFLPVLILLRLGPGGLLGCILVVGLPVVLAGRVST
jgi:hypothetical protein